MAIEVFNRYESKFLINAEIRDLLIKDLLLHMEPDKHNGEDGYDILNIYYDTIDDELITTSIEKPKYKEKLRLRGYRDITSDSIVFLEVKKKFNGIVNKRRCKLKLSEAYEFLKTKKIPPLQPYMNPQVLKELQYLIQRYDLHPKIFLGYKRKAFFEKTNRDLRVSFDQHITSRRDDLFLEHGFYGREIVENVVIMEIKVSQAIPLWLLELLKKYQISATSFSKYGTEYRQYVEQKKGDIQYV